MTIQSVGQWFKDQVAAPYRELWPMADQQIFHDGAARHVRERATLNYILLDFVEAHDNQLRNRAALSLLSFVIASELDPMIISERQLARIDKVRALAFGNVYDLCLTLMQDPALNTYLTSLGNRKFVDGDPDYPNQPDENYARELMQLFMVGTEALDVTGYPVLDATGNATLNYTADDVLGLAAVLTGIELDDVPVGEELNAAQRKSAAGVQYATDFTLPVKLVPEDHDFSEKAFLGKSVPAKAAPYTQADVLDDFAQAARIITDHPSCYPFIAFNVIQHVGHTNPDPEIVRRAVRAMKAGRFVLPDDGFSTVEDRTVGSGIPGCMEAMWASIVCSPDLWNTPSDQRTKVHHPDHLMMQVWRFFVTNPRDVIVEVDYHNPFNPETGMWGELGGVFSYETSVFGRKPPRHEKPGSAVTDADLLYPEGDLWNESTLLGYINWVTAMLSDLDEAQQARRQGGDTSRSAFDADTTALEALYQQDPDLVIDEINQKMCGGRLEADTVALMKQNSDRAKSKTGSNPVSTIFSMAGIAATSEEFIVRGAI